MSLNEGLNEGGGSYAINSDFFLGYVMPLLKDQYLHIMSKSYYGGQYRVSMNLPYDKVEILNDHEAYLAPNTFSDYRRFIDRAQVFQMTRTSTIREISIPSKIKVSVHHDSIWNHYDDLDVLGVSCISRDQRFFFESIHKTIELSRASIEGILNYCEVNKLERLGLTPWAKGKYASFIQKVRIYRADYPKKIQLFHLNKNDYKILKEYSEDKE
ncbi:hypothetical protein [Membranihabitans marinus]|uniref:hypothetical protein n=1 Tax=Membranihabitans marinus TaxID=1227546 RepID=UPI001F439E32|nr:hypothetical protein [Membranihabitans marinus]